MKLKKLWTYDGFDWDNHRGIQIGLKYWIIRTFNLKGSWYWAKKQMMNGKIIRCRHWTGALKIRIDNSTNTLLQKNFNIQEKHCEWERSNHFLSYENYADYYVFNWDEFKDRK